MRLGRSVSADGEQRRRHQADGLPLTSVGLEADRPRHDLWSFFGRAGDRDRFDEANRRAGEVSADSEQVTGDTRQEPVREPGHGELAGDLPAVSGFIQPMQQAVNTTDVELLSHPECRRGEPLKLAAGQCRALGPGLLCRVVDRRPT